MVSEHGGGGRPRRTWINNIKEWSNVKDYSERKTGIIAET